MKRIVLLTFLATALLVGMLGTPAGADSPVITASNGQCEAKWLSGSNQFRIRDNATADNDYCYVQYGWSSSNLVNRISRPQDVGGYGYYTVTVGSNSTIYWKICKERQNDPDICSSVRGDVT